MWLINWTLFSKVTPFE